MQREAGLWEINDRIIKEMRSLSLLTRSDMNFWFLYFNFLTKNDMVRNTYWAPDSFICHCMRKHGLTMVIIWEIDLEMKKDMAHHPSTCNLAEKSEYAQVHLQDEASLYLVSQLLGFLLHSSPLTPHLAFPGYGRASAAVGQKLQEYKMWQAVEARTAVILVTDDVSMWRTVSGESSPAFLCFPWWQKSYLQ